MTIYELADLMDLEIIVRRYPNQKGRWTASFENCDVMENGFLKGKYGDGRSPEMAMSAYLVEIRGKKIAWIYGDDRKEFHVPESVNLG